MESRDDTTRDGNCISQIRFQHLPWSTMSDGPIRCDLVVRHGYVLSLDDERRVYPDGAVAIRGSRIVAIGPDRDVGVRADAARTIDARGGVVHPGFIDVHVHAMSASRGAYPDTAALPDGMGVNRRWWAAADDEDEHASTLLVAAEMLSNGTTCFLEAGTAHAPDAVADAMRAVGIRGVVGDPFLWDHGVPAPGQDDPRAPRSTARALDLLGSQLHRNADPDALVRGAVAVFGYGTASDELLVAAKATADRAGAVLTQHQSYAPDDVAADADRRGSEPVLHLERLGVLGDNALFSHMNVLSPAERDAVVRTGTAVAWCPSCALSWGAGVGVRGRHAELWRDGATVGLAADGAASSCRYDLSLQGLLALLSSRDRAADRAILAAEDVLEMATLGGARALGLQDEIGALTAGRRADLVIRRRDLPETRPDVDPVQALVYAAGSKSVDTVLVDGCVVYAGGAITRVAPDEVLRLGERSGRRMRERLGLRPASRWPEVR
jgi:cytosine/adenosine deaminase-related metal-dependent hydrolase